MKIKHMIAAILCCALLAGCSGMSLTGSDVLSPPEAHGAQGELEALIGKSAGGSYTLVYPATGDLQGAVIERDVDGDGVDEAVAMYRGQDDLTHVLSLYRDGDDYAAAGDAVLPTDMIERADFADLDGDGKEEFIIAYPADPSDLLSLTVICMGADYAQTELPAACCAYAIGDADSEKGKDAVLFTKASPVASASAQLAGYRDGALYVKSSCEMDSAITSYQKITCGAVSRDVNGIFVDGCTPEGEYTTQVLYCDPDEGLLNPLFIYTGYGSTHRFCPVLSADVDSDGLIELPVCSLFDFEEDSENADDVCSRITWNNYDTAAAALVTKKTAVLCDNDGALFDISDSRVGAVTARRREGAVEIYAWEYRDGAMRRTDLLLTIRRRPKDSYDSFELFETVLGESDDAVYTYVIADSDNRLGYTDDEVRAGFVLPETAKSA